VLSTFLFFLIGILFSNRFQIFMKRILGPASSGYIFIFWVFFPILFSWLFNRAYWLLLPNLWGLIFIPIGLSITLSLVALEYYYRIVLMKNKALAMRINRVKFGWREMPRMLFNQLYKVALPEECILRGFLIVFLMDSLGLIATIFVSATLSGLCHLRSGWLNDWLRVFFTGTRGFVYALIFVLSRSVWVSIIVHVLSNMIAVPVVKSIASCIRN